MREDGRLKDEGSRWQRWLRRHIKPPFWVLEYRCQERGRAEYCRVALLADASDRAAALAEAERYVAQHAQFNGTYSLAIHIQPWWRRLYRVPLDW